MRKVAIAVLVLGLAATSAWAESFPDARDTGLCGHSSEVNVSTGISGQHRVAKAYQHQMIMDWDTVAIQEYIDANKPVELDTQVELFLCVASASGNDTPIDVSAYAGNDWVEGQTTTYGWLTWPYGAANAEATYNYAATATQWNDLGFVEVDVANSTAWSSQDDGSDVSSFRVIFDGNRGATTTGMVLPSTAVDGDWISVVLDDAVVAELLTNPLNRGLYTNGDSWENSNVYSRDQAGGLFAPYLEVTFVPEPATMGLLVLGGVAALIRRKK